MSAVLLAYPNRADAPLFTGAGGCYTTGLPLSYLQTRQVAQMARSLTADKRCTWFYVVPTSSIGVGVAALANHNMTYTGQWRVRGWSADPRPAIDSTFVGGALPTGWTFTRGSSGTYFASNGLLKTAASGEARFPYSSSLVCLGLLLERQSTNNILWCRDGTNAAWTKTTMTTALTATGIDGAANSATRLTAGGANSRITQACVAGVCSVYLRRVSGSGTVSITGNNFTGTTTCTLSTSWQRFSVTAAGASTFGIQIATNGDVIEMDYAQSEAGVTATMPILTTTGTVTRSADAVNYTGAAAAGASLSTGALMMQGTLLDAPASTLPLLTMADGGGTNAVTFNMTSGAVLQGSLTAASVEQLSGIAGSAITLGTNFTVAESWAANDVRASFNAAAVVSDSTVTVSSNAVSSLQVQGNACLYLTRLRLYGATKTNAQLQALGGSEQEVAADFDSGLQNAWPAAWVAATSAEQQVNVRSLALYQLGSLQTYPYWRIDMVDEANPAGYLQLGRVFLGPAVQPAINMSYGAGIGYESRDLIVETDSGSEYGLRRPSPRVATFALEFASETEAMGTWLEAQRQLGTYNELLFAWDPSDTTHLPRRSFLARLRKLSPLDTPWPNLWKTGFEVKELI